MPSATQQAGVQSWQTTPGDIPSRTPRRSSFIQPAQFTRSGLVLVQGKAEGDCIQSLVYCAARDYRVAGHGIWERGDKGKHGLPERNASSIGMAKAALSSLDGLDLYGPHGDGTCKLLIP